MKSRVWAGILMGALAAGPVLAAGKEQSVTLEGDRNILDRITTEVHADRLSLSISGAGDAQLKDLVVNDAAVSIAGAGQARVNPKDNLRADVAGFGKISYPRDPKVRSNISGVEKE